MLKGVALGPAVADAEYGSWIESELIGSGASFGLPNSLAEVSRATL